MSRPRLPADARSRSAERKRSRAVGRGGAKRL